MLFCDPQETILHILFVYLSFLMMIVNYKSALLTLATVNKFRTFNHTFLNGPKIKYAKKKKPVSC